MAFDVAHERNVAQGLAHRALQESDQLDPLSDLVATTERLLTRWREHGADVTEGVALLDAVRDGPRAFAEAAVRTRKPSGTRHSGVRTSGHYRGQELAI